MLTVVTKPYSTNITVAVTVTHTILKGQISFYKIHILHILESS